MAIGVFLFAALFFVIMVVKIIIPAIEAMMGVRIEEKLPYYVTMINYVISRGEKNVPIGGYKFGPYNFLIQIYADDWCLRNYIVPLVRYRILPRGAIDCNETFCICFGTYKNWNCTDGVCVGHWDTPHPSWVLGDIAGLNISEKLFYNQTVDPEITLRLLCSDFFDGFGGEEWAKDYITRMNCMPIKKRYYLAVKDENCKISEETCWKNVLLWLHHRHSATIRTQVMSSYIEDEWRFVVTDFDIG